MSDPQRLRTRADEILELHETGRLEDALTACAQLLTDAADHDLADEVVRESVFTARFQQAVIHTELGELERAAEAYADAAATPTDLDDPDQRHELAMALLNQGICLDALDRSEEALGVYDRLVVRLGDADDPVTTDQVVRARVNRAAAMLALDRPSEALTVAEALAGELDPQDILQAEQLAMTSRLCAAALVRLDRVADAVTVLAGVERCSDEEPAARAQVAAGLGDRAQLLLELEREREAIEVLDRAAERYGADADPDVGEVVSDLLRVEVEALEQVGDHDRAAALRDRIAG